MSDMLARVRALLDKAQSTEFPAEAEALTTKAMQLMARHNIDDAMLAATERRSDLPGQQRIDMTNPYSSEKEALLNAVATAFHCRIILYRTRGTRTVNSCDLIGHDSDRQCVELLYTSLLLQVATQITHQYPPYYNAFGDTPAASVTLYRRSWLLGFADQVGERLREIHAAARTVADAAVPTGGRSTALVLRDRREVVDTYFEEMFPDLKKARPHTLPDRRGYQAGARAGDKADLGGRAVGGRTRNALTGS